VTTLTSLHAGHDIAYFLNGHGAGGCAGAMSYYTASGEPPGVWAGKAAAKLGLTGEVDPKVIGNLYMHGIGPGGERLRPELKARTQKEDDEREAQLVAAFRDAHPFASASEIEEERASIRGRAGQVTVPYLDLTISAVKSVSVLHASLKVAAARTDDQVLAARLNALADGIEADLVESAKAAIGYAEQRACYTRTGHHSATTGEWRDGDGLVSAVFAHHISRDGDPQLHVHAAIANLVQRADGADSKWRALDARQAFQMRLWIAAHVDREMEARLIRRGLIMVPREDGNGSEVGGVSREVMDLFSSRVRGISPELAKLIGQYTRAHGRPPSARTRWLLGQQAAQNSRRSKARARQRAGGQDHGEDLDEAARLTAWEEQTAREETRVLSQVWHDVEAFAAGKSHSAPDLGDLARAARIAVAEVQRQHAVFTVAELAFEVHRALPPGASPADIDTAVALATTDPEVLEVAPAPDPVDASALGVRKDGTNIYRPPNEARYTTTGQLDLESRIMELARRTRVQRIDEATARRAVAACDLDESQREAVVAMLTSGQAVTVLTAPAGAGKTHTVAVFAQLWAELTGHRVIGLATSENAARVMAGEGLSAAYNIAAFLGKIKGSEELRYPVSLNPGDVLVLDESSQVSTSDLDLVMRYADRAGASIVPTGDIEQLGAVEAGGMFRAMAEELGAVTLTEVRRFAEPWEAAASLRLHDGDKSALAAYAARARIRGFDRQGAQARAVGAWLADHLRGKDALLLAGSNEEAAALSTMVQTKLIALGRVQDPCTPLADGNLAGTGDLLRARLNCTIDAGGRRLTNRDTVRVTGWQSGNARAVRQLPGGGRSEEFVIRRAYLAESAELTYAGNVHVAQGRTVDISHLLATETLSKESLYVAMTRGREGNYAWTVTGETAPEGKQPYQQATPESVLAGIMERESRELTAHEQIRQAQEWAGGTGHVLAIWAAAVNDLARENTAECLRGYLSESEYGRYCREHSRPALGQALRERQLAGQDIRELVAAITSEPLNGARSVSSVLHGRLAQLPRIHRSLSWEARTPANAPEFAKEAARVLDAREQALGERLLESPEPWLVDRLGIPPRSEESPVLRAEYAFRAGKAAAYREAAGITRPDQAISPEPHRDRPEVEAMRKATITNLEIRDDAELLRAAGRGELEARVLEGERAWANAPEDVSGRLKATAQAESDTRQQALDADLAGDRQGADNAHKLASILAHEKTGLEGIRGEYEAWETRTAERRSAADQARAELRRRGHEQESPREEPESPEPLTDWWAQFNADTEAAERSLASQKAQAEAEGQPWPPEPRPAPELDTWQAPQADPASKPEWQAPEPDMAEAETDAYQGAAEPTTDIEAELG
jgi:conjugative relaxase-like TrwC/TraI family protein